MKPFDALTWRGPVRRLHTATLSEIDWRPGYPAMREAIELLAEP